MPDLCQRLRAGTAEVIALWEAAAHVEPWLLLPEEHRHDFLPAVLEHLADAVLCHESSPARVRRMIESAGKHGHDRALQGVPDFVVLNDYYLLRQAIWEYFRRLDLGEPGTRAIMRVDVAVGLLTRASMLGYHRTQLERDGRYESVLDQLFAEAPQRLDG